MELALRDGGGFREPKLLGAPAVFPVSRLQDAILPLFGRCFIPVYLNQMFSPPDTVTASFTCMLKMGSVPDTLQIYEK